MAQFFDIVLMRLPSGAGNKRLETLELRGG